MNVFRLGIPTTIGLLVILLSVIPLNALANTSSFSYNEFNAVTRLLNKTQASYQMIGLNNKFGNKNTQYITNTLKVASSQPRNKAISYSTSNSSSRGYNSHYSKHYTANQLMTPVVTRVKKRVITHTKIKPINHYQYNSTWRQLFGGFQFKNYNHKPMVQQAIRSSSKPRLLQRLAERSTTYLPMIVKEVRRRRMPSEIALLPLVESGFKSTAYSTAGAAGIWQFISATGKRYGLKQSHSYDGRYDPLAATHAALNYLTTLNKRFDDWFLALAAYNCGENRVAREIAYNKKRGLPTDFWHLSLPKETRHYVPKLLAYKEIFKSSHTFGFQLPYLPAKSKIVSLTINKRLDLKKVAQKAGLPRLTLTKLNRHYKNGITQPRHSKSILVPTKHVRKIHQIIASLRSHPAVIVSYKKKKKRSKKRRRARSHRVKAGETLYYIAKKYKVSIKKIMRLNRMRSTRIKIGSRLRIT